jgi:replication fork protection complex subunit Tof1/Swi1
MELRTATVPSEYVESYEPHQDSQSRIQLFEPIVRRVVDALGGAEAPSDTYKPGDSASSCLSDLKKLWRRDEDDDERTIARIFFSTLVLPNDLIPMLLVTAGQGMVEDPRAIKCADLICAMTWPIDIAEELKELDEEANTPEYTQLLTSHLVYKSALLKPGVLMALLHIAIPPLSRSQKERTPRDAQIVAVILYIIRNLAFIKDPPANTHLSADRAQLANLQSRLIRTLDETHILDLLLTMAANEEKDKMLEGLNVIVLEILYLLFRGVRPAELVTDQTQVKLLCIRYN